MKRQRSSVEHNEQEPSKIAKVQMKRTILFKENTNHKKLKLTIKEENIGKKGPQLLCEIITTPTLWSKIMSFKPGISYKDIERTSKQCDKIAASGDLYGLQYMETYHTQLCTSEGATRAAQYGHLDILKWLATRSPPILCTRWGATLAATQGHLEVLKWLHSPDINIQCTRYGVQKSMQNNHIETWRWLIKQGVC